MANPITMLLEGNGSLAGRDRAGAFTATGSGALRYAAANGARVNYVTNPQFANDTTGWVDAFATTTFSRVADSDFSGGYCCEVSGSTANNGIATTVYMRERDLSGNPTVTISFDVKWVSGATDFRLRTITCNASGTTSGAGTTDDTIVLTSSVQRVSKQFAITSITGGHGLVVYFRRPASTASTFRISNITVEYGATAGAWFTPVWLDPRTGVLGTAHASPSVSRACFWIEEATTNTVPDPSFEAATITTNWAANGSATISKVTTHVYLGSNAGKCSCTASTSDAIRQINTSGAAAADGQTWTVSARVRAFASGDVGKTVKLGITERTSANVTVVDNASEAFTLTDAWQLISYTVTLSGGGTVAKVTCSVWNAAATAVDFVVDCVQLEQKAYATSYCDGTLGTGYSWSGTAHASTSSRAVTTVLVPVTSNDRFLASKGAAVVQAQRLYNNGSNHYPWSCGDLVGANTSSLAQINGAFVGAWMRRSGTSVQSPDSGNDTVGSTGKHYAGWDADSIDAAFNSGALVSSAQAAAPNETLQDNKIYVGSYPGGNPSIDGYLGPVLIYDRPLTAAERAKVNAAIDSNGAASLWTVLGSNAYRNFQLRPVSQ